VGLDEEQLESVLHPHANVDVFEQNAAFAKQEGD
jgi:hypothetical protein